MVGTNRQHRPQKEEQRTLWACLHRNLPYVPNNNYKGGILIYYTDGNDIPSFPILILPALDAGIFCD